MLQNRPLTRRSAPILLSVAFSVLSVPAAFAGQVPLDQNPVTQDDRSDLSTWSDDVWNAALDGNKQAIETYLSNIPDGRLDEEVEGLRALVAAQRLHVSEAASDRTEDLEEARAEMASLFEEGNIVEALSSAVAVQTHSDDFMLALGEESMQALIARGVIGDFRAPDLIRFGITPLYLDEADIDRAVEILIEIMATDAWDTPEYRMRKAVT